MRLLVYSLSRFQLSFCEKINSNNKEYLEYWKETFQDKSKLRILFSGLDPYLEFMDLGHVFDNSRLLEDTGMVNSEPADVYMQNSMNFVEKIDILEGAIDP